MPKATARAELENAIAGKVRWVEHAHMPKPCCTEAILDAIPEGWSKHEGRWVETCDLLLDVEGRLREEFRLLGVPWVYDHQAPSGPVFRHECGSKILWSHIEEHEGLCR